MRALVDGNIISYAGACKRLHIISERSAIADAKRLEMARALQANPATKKVSVINRGIGGKAIWGGNGPAAKNRFVRDVLGTTGAKYMILLIGSMIDVKWFE